MNKHKLIWDERTNSLIHTIDGKMKSLLDLSPQYEVKWMDISINWTYMQLPQDHLLDEWEE